MRFFVSGTDTGVGKTVATGWLAKRFSERGLRVVTQKLVQTGCSGVSEDIIEHRKIMGCGMLPCDLDFTTCRYVFKYPASPHLAASMEGVDMDFNLVSKDTDALESRFDAVFVEGAGGLVVPSKLGSLNHALLSLDFCAARKIRLAGIVYNAFPKAPRQIEDSTREYLAETLKKDWPGAELLEMGEVK